ncbi:DMT family transporter [Limibaculum sp. M0105]|uniref:DMT family transporter n=1 Tax=Thermohalobaculum xanthum TaxID=2753746 RepID=A0A8J7M844_9RHOB|nr:DMT family transporter [Thermohalobaculum xanthum]MBK0399955.1 DMT family transporter [Thermohalobaculum xanthum]
MNPLRGIALKVGSVAIFMAMSTLIKITAEHVPSGQTVFFRSFFAIPVILAWLWWRGDLATGLSTRNPMGHLWRGLVGGTAMGLSFTALGLLPLPEVTAIGYATPLIVTILAAMFLGEQIRLYRLGAVCVGLVGVLIVLGPRLTVLTTDGVSDAETLGAVIMLSACVFMALAACFVRKLVHTEQTSAIVFYFSLTCTVLSLLTLPFGWVVPSPAETLMLIGAGLLGGLAQILLTSSYRHADVAVIAPFDYTSMLLALVIGWFVFSEAPTAATLGGASIVIAAGLFIIWRERQLGLERARARKVMTPQG